MKLDEAMMLVGDENTPRTQRIAAGALLWRFMDEATNALDALKRDLRAEAASLACSVVAFEGDDHSLCRVLVSPRTLKVREGVTVDAAREALGDAFDTVFEARLALRSSSPSALESLTEDAREAFRALVTEVANPSRVSFRGGSASAPALREPARTTLSGAVPTPRAA